MRFSTSFFHVIAVTLLSISAASCAFVIPPEQNAPRNNEVLGDRRKPQMNVNVIGPQTNMVRPAKLQMREDRIASNEIPPEPTTTMPPQVALAQTGRHVPVENMEFQMAENDSYPSLHSVPPRPVMTGPHSAQERLHETQSTLEQDRADAFQQKEMLTKDAADEPSMLSELPKTDGVVPPSDPVRVAPIAPQPAVIMTPSVTVPEPSEIRQRPAAEPSAIIAPPFMRPIPPVATAPVKAEPVHVATPRVVIPAQTADSLPPAPRATIPAPAPYAPVVAVAPKAEPIILKPPVTTAAVAEEPEPVTVATAPTVQKGDFDPLAAADNAPIATPSASATHSTMPAYASNRYIAPSRYADHRY